MKNETTKKHDHAALESLHLDAKGCDSEIFAEMRSNLLLVSGEHYNRRQSTFFKKVRDARELSSEQKIRLTKNHVQKIAKTYVNNIISMAPGVGFEPKNQTELQDQKAAELHHSVWRHAVDNHNLDEKIDEWCEDFVTVGEAATKIFWDPTEGTVKAYKQKLDDNGAPMLDENGQPARGEPVYTGAFVFEDLCGFNILRAPESKSMRESPYLIIEKMKQVDALLKKFPGKEDFIKASADETFVVFDAAKGGYRKTDKEVMVKEYYFRPCPLYPRGYFYISTKDGTLAEGELPGGIFPIITQYFDRIQTTPRGRSAIKHMRPYQAEINRAASKMAEHQITLGDDKLILVNGTKVSAGAALPGVRSINVTGAAPTVMAGRDGSQYLNTLQANIAELYDVMNVAEDSMEKDGQLDPYALLFRSASQKKKFQRYIKRFERFLIEVCKTYLKLAKIHLPDDALVMAVGKNEYINIKEFRNSTDLCYQITVAAQADDIETKMGKQLVLNHALQYVGQKLEKEDIGKIMRAMPYGNFEESFDDMTIDYDSATNDILALDRGEKPPVNEYDNHVYMIKRLVARMRQPDFKLLHPQIQQTYEMKKELHMQHEVERQKKILAAEAGYIPTDGYMVVCDFYVPHPTDATKQPQRVKLPARSLEWLINTLQAQGQSLEQLESMNRGAVAQMAEMVLGQRSAGAPNGMGPMPQLQGEEMPGGMRNVG